MNNDNASPPVFTGAELALADMLAAVIEDLIAQQSYSRDEFERTSAVLRSRYEGNRLRSSVAMIDYLRRQVGQPSGRDDIVRLQRFAHTRAKETN
jgi:hypothetical protein